MWALFALVLLIAELWVGYLMGTIKKVLWQWQKKTFPHPVWIGAQRWDHLPSLWLGLQINHQYFQSELCPLPHLMNNSWPVITSFMSVISKLEGKNLALEMLNPRQDLFQLLPDLQLPPILNFALENIFLQLLPGIRENLLDDSPLETCHFYDQQRNGPLSRRPLGKIKIRPPLSAEILRSACVNFAKVRLDGNCSFDLANFPYFLLENVNALLTEIEFLEEPLANFDLLWNFNHQWQQDCPWPLALDEHLTFYREKYLPYHSPLSLIRYYVFRPSQYGLAAGRRLIEQAQQDKIKVVISSSYDHPINFSSLEYLARYQNLFQQVVPGLDTHKFLETKA